MPRRRPLFRAFAGGRFLRPAQAFVRTEAASGIFLLAAAVVALGWANSPWPGAYTTTWAREIHVSAGAFALDLDWRHAINEGLMTVFFFVAGLEIKRELVHGELASVRRAALPVAAAAGGMAIPALIYAAINDGGAGARGWGIPMATDIAFALGLLALLHGRVPFGLKVFLLALAIVDDLGAILVIAAFYSGAIATEPLLWGAAIVGTAFALRLAGVRATLPYWACGLLLWAAIYHSGLHATLAGVLLAALTPSRPARAFRGFAARAASLARLATRAHRRGDLDAVELAAEGLEALGRSAESPLDRLERQLHPWVSFLIVPLFALANAGIAIDGGFLRGAAGSPVTLGVVAGLVLGKVSGITLAAFLAVRLGLATLPGGVTLRHIVGAGLVAGIGFTVSLFVAGLAFTDATIDAEARAGILAGSLISGLTGYAFLRFSPSLR